MPKTVALNPSEAACLTTLRSGSERKALIAMRARLNLRQAKRALGGLASLDIAASDDDRTWHLTPRGKAADILIAPSVRTRGRNRVSGWPPGPAAAHLLALLDRPRHGAELGALLGVTRQRVHQLVVALFARDLIRAGDPGCPGFVVALKEDPSLLLRQDQERVLSAFPDTEATTLSKIALVTHMAKGRTAAVAESLRETGLIEKTGAAVHGGLYRLTATGSAHWQRSTAGPRADVPPLPFRSNRVRDVLSFLESEGPTRTRDVGLRLEISQTSINALMQYLKRKKVVRTRSGARHAPHELTPEGRQMLAAMKRKAAMPPRPDTEARGRGLA